MIAKAWTTQKSGSEEAQSLLGSHFYLGEEIFKNTWRPKYTLGPGLVKRTNSELLATSAKRLQTKNSYAAVEVFPVEKKCDITL